MLCQTRQCRRYYRRPHLCRRNVLTLVMLLGLDVVVAAELSETEVVVPALQLLDLRPRKQRGT
jgi:hypothetical protein